MSDDELKRRLRARMSAGRAASHKGEVSADGAASYNAASNSLMPTSEQNLGRLLERVERLERQLSLIYKVCWRTSAALMGLAAASFGWDWVSKLLRAIGG